MPSFASANGVIETLAAMVKPVSKQCPTPWKPVVTGLLSKDATGSGLTRRLALGLASMAVISSSSNGASLAEGNGFWSTELPLPKPSVINNIANEKTGTRSFLKKGMYVADIGARSSGYRINKCAFDLLALEDLIAPDTLNYVWRYLRIKSTTMYYDFDRIISAASDEEEKVFLLNLANDLFDRFEQLEDAAKRKNLSQTQSRYRETAELLNVIMDRIA